MTGLPFVYQTVHLRGGRPLDVARHAAALDTWAAALFGIGYRPSAAGLERRIAEVAERERYPRDLSSFVRLEVDADGTERLLPAGISLYEGFALRSLTPDAALVAYPAPFGPAPSSARMAAAALARTQAQRAGAQVAVQCCDGALLSADDAPLFALRDGAVLAPAALRGVERDRVLRACALCGLAAREEPLAAADLGSFDELFYADHRGVTALSHCDGVPFMALAAERIAAAMNRLR